VQRQTRSKPPVQRTVVYPFDASIVQFCWTFLLNLELSLVSRMTEFGRKRPVINCVEGGHSTRHSVRDR